MFYHDFAMPMDKTIAMIKYFVYAQVLNSWILGDNTNVVWNREELKKLKFENGTKQIRESTTHQNDKDATHKQTKRSSQMKNSLQYGNPFIKCVSLNAIETVHNRHHYHFYFMIWTC